MFPRLVAQQDGEINVSGLTTDGGGLIGIQSTTGGSVLANHLTGLNDASLTVDAAGTVAVSSLASFTDGTLTVNGGTPSFPSLADIDDSDLYVNAGTLALPMVKSYTGDPKGGDTTLQASGSGSVLDLSHLTTFTGGQTYYGGGVSALVAQQGGEVNLSSLATDGGGIIDVQATGSGSRINLASLANFTNSSGALVVTNGGTVQTASDLTVSQRAVTIDSQSTLQVGSLDLENGSTLSAGGTFAGNLVNGGVVYPGANGTAGQLTITGNYTQTSAGTLSLDLGGLTAGTQFDQLVVAGNTTLGGTLSVDLLGNYLPNPGDSFSVLAASDPSGTFASASGLQLGHGLELDPAITASGVTLTTDEPAGPEVTTTAPSGTVIAPISSMDVTFNQAVATASFTPAQVSLTGPSGAVTISSVTALSPTTFQISFGAQTAAGVYTYSIGPGVTDLAGNAMDQDGDGSSFGQSDDAYTGTFTLLTSFSWTGGGDGKSWSDPNNWAGGAVPGAFAHVTIDVPGLTVTYAGGSTSIGSITSEANLVIASGSIQVTSGASDISGTLTVSAGASLTVTGSGTTFTAEGTTTADAANLSVSGGATLSLPELTSYTAGGGTSTLSATGAGSVLSLPKLATLTGINGYGSLVQVATLSGGDVEMPTLTQISGGPVQLTSDGTGSVLDVAALSSYSGTYGANSFSTLQVSNNGTLKAASLSSLDLVYVPLSSGTLSLVSLKEATGTDFEVSGGATLSLPALASYTAGGGTSTLSASGSGSLLSLPQLTTLTGTNGYGSLVQVEALSGGDVEMPALTQISSGPITLIVDGTLSVLNVPALSSYSGTYGANSFSTLQVSNNGTLKAASLSSLDLVYVPLSSGTLSLVSLKEATGTDYEVSGGATLSLPALTSYTAVDYTSTLSASGTGSVLSLPKLATLTGNNGYGSLVQVEALSGGDVEMPALTQISGGPAHLTSDGTGSVLDVATLSSYSGAFGANSFSALQVSNHGTLQDDSLTSLSVVNLNLDGSGTLSYSQIASFTYGTLTSSGGTLSLAGLTDADASTLLVNGGATLSLPALTSYTAADYTSTLSASGSGSLLSLPKLATLTGNNSYGSLVQVEALSGGDVEMPALTQISGGPVQLTSDGTGSVLDVAALSSYSGSFGEGTFSALQVSNHGTLQDGNLTSLSEVDLTLDGTGTLDYSQIASFTDAYATLALNGGTLSLSGLTDADGSSLQVSGGATLSLPALTSYTASSVGSTLSASSTGSVLSLPKLATITGEGQYYGSRVQVQALAGGDLEMPALTTISGGPVQLTSDGTGSILDVAALSSYRGNFGDSIFSALQVSNHGTLQDGSLSSLSAVDLHWDGTGTFSYSQIASFTYATFAWSGGTLSLAGLTDADGASLLVSGGATLSLPALTSYTAGGGTSTLSASGSGSLLSLPKLATLTGINGYGSLVQVEALSGGSVEMPALTQISGGPVHLTSDGTGSVLDVAALSSYTGTSGDANFSALQVTDKGMLEDNSHLSVTAASITFDAQSTFQVGTLDLESGSSLSASGTLAANLVNGAIVYPGGNGMAGLLTIRGNYTQTASGTLSLDVGGLTAGTLYDQLVVGGNTTLGGTLNDGLINNYVPNVGDSFSAVIAANLSGAFASATGTRIGNGLELDPTVSGSKITLTTESSAGPMVLSSTPSGTFDNQVSQIDVTFNKAIVPASFTTSQASLTGPNGAVAITGVLALSPTTIQISFATQSAPGSYTLSVGPAITDLNGNEMDQDGDDTNGQSDDTYTSTFTIALPELAVTAIVSAPTSAGEGSTIPVSWKVSDASTTIAAPGPWTDAVYLSTKSTLDSSAIRLTSVAAPPTSPLAAGASYTDNASITIPGNLATGNYYLLFVADDNGGQAESDAGNDSNNVMSQQITLSAADLQVGGVTGPASGFTGQSVLVSWTDVNNGTAQATGPWVDNVYLASDAQGDNPTLLGGFTFLGSLAVGASEQRTEQVVLPQTAGNQWFVVTTNATQTAAEGMNYGNDTTVATDSIDVIQTPLPDLVVTGITPPPNGVFSGSTVPISFTVKNRGQAPTTASTWQDWVILSQDPNLGQTYLGLLSPTGPGGDQTLNNQPLVVGVSNPSYLGVGDSYQQTVNVTLPISAEGSWYVYVVPDGTGYQHPFAMPEASRTDKLAISTSFGVTLSPPPDLDVTSVKAPAEDFSGQPTTISWTVANNGTGPTSVDSWTDAVYMSTKATLDASAIPIGLFTHQGVVSAGSSYTDSETVDLPVGVSGAFYFLVQTDFRGQVFQNGATANNVGATNSTETVNLTPPPQLVTSAVSPPATGLAGHALNVSYTVTNAGAGATPNYSWSDTFYLSPTQRYDPATAIPLGAQVHQGSLAAGAAYTSTVSLTLPTTAAGTYYLLVDADSAGNVFQLNRSQSLAASDQTITISPDPADLVVSTATAPGVVLRGNAVAVSWTVMNQGPGDTNVAFWKDSIYADTGTTLDSNAVFLGTYLHFGTLSANAAYTQTELVTLPIQLQGNYNLFVVADSTSLVYESAAGNRVSSPVPISLQLSIGQGSNVQYADVSDLQVTSVNAPTTALTGGTLPVSWTVTNNGPGTTNANYWFDDVWLSSNTTLGVGTDNYLGTVGHVNALAANASYSVSATFTVPQGLAAGNWFVIVATNRPVAPPGTNGGVEVVYETNDTNNETAANPATVVTQSALPEPDLSNITAISPTVSGQDLSVGWTVTNNGGGTGNVPITDSVYLSYNQNLNSAYRYLGSVTNHGGLVNGASYTQNASFQLPAGLSGTFYVFVVSNSNSEVVESSSAVNVGYDTQPVQINLPPPADLVAGAITLPVPPSGDGGQSVTITYQVTNNSSNPATGHWYDALYLSPTTTWSVGDPVLGLVYQNQNLAPGQGYTGSWTGPLPGVAPGSYYVILRANIRNNLPEATLNNNESASQSQIAIDAQALTLGTATDATLNQGQSAYYKVVVSAGQTLQVSINGQEAAAYNELYASFGTMPTRSQYDYRYSQAFAPNQQITIPTTQAGAYYILVYGDLVPSAPENYAALAALVPFSIQTVSPAQAGTGPATLTIKGAQFNFGTTFQLRNASGTVIDATRTLLGDSVTAYATFDLAGQALGSYDVYAIASDGTTTELAAGLSVVAATQPNSVKLGLVVLSGIVVGRPGTIEITYSNPGNTDLPAPLILLDGQNALFQTPGLTSYTRSSLQLLGYNPNGPFGTLPPGFQGSISLSFKPVTAGAGLASEFTVSTLLDPSEPFAWNALAANDVPLDTSPQQWSALVSQAAPVLGSTWGDVVSFLDSNSVQLLKNTAGQGSPAAMNSLFNFDALLQYAVGIYGSTPPAPSTPSFPVLASEGEVSVYNAHVDGSGNPLPLDPNYPTFVLIPGFGGYQADLGSLASAIAADTAAYPNGDVNVLIADWQGATAGPTIDGAIVPWMAALHVDADGTQLGDILSSLQQAGSINFSSTTVIGTGLGVYVGNQAARITQGLQNAIALNPDSELAGYLPTNLTQYFQHSTAYETNSLFDAQRSNAASVQTLNTGDVNNPLLQHTFGVPWLTQQIQAGNSYLLSPTHTAQPGSLPPGNDPALPAEPEELVVGSDSVVQRISIDPNSIIGPKGSGTADDLPPDDPLPYTIDFTNLPTANAPAQQVTVTEDLDPGLDWQTFRLGSFGFGGETFSVQADSAFFQSTIDETQQFGFDVQVTANIDESTGIASWTFTTIDPATGQTPLDPTVGLLPPNTSNGIGEGFVSYTIEAPASDPNGTVVSAQAAVTFDRQPPLDTNKVSNTIDAGTGLSSTVAPLPAYENTSSFHVSWSGSDSASGPGIAGYTIYVSDNSGPYKAWLTNTTLTAAPYSGQDGHTYSFYSVATDGAGNVETSSGTGQASTTVDVTPPHTTDQPTGTAGTNGWFRGAVSVTLSASDATSGVAATFYTIDGGLQHTYTGSAFTVSGDGTHHINFWSVDNAGNTESAQTDAIKIDTTPPITMDTLSGTLGNAGWYTSASVSVSLTPSDATSGVAATYYTIDSGTRQTYTGSAFSVTGEGTHHINFWSVDIAGNTDATETDSFKIDSIAPTTTFSILQGTMGNDSWFTSGVIVGLSANDSGSGPANTYYSLDGGSMQTYTVPFTVTGDAIHTLVFDSLDIAGNQEARQTQTIKIDTTPPVLHLPAHQTFEATQSSGVVVNYTGATATDNVSGVVSLTSSPPSGSVFPLGTTTVFVTATDDAGNQTTGSFTVNVELSRADHLAMTTPIQVVAGGTFSVTVDALNSGNVLDPNYQGSVALALTGGPAGGVLSGVVVEPVVAGVATFTNLTLSTAGSYTLLAASTSDLLAGTGSVSVIAAPQFKVSLAPSTRGNTAAGQPFTVTITALNKGKPYAGYLDTIVLTSSDPQVAPSTLTFGSSDDGVKTFTLTLKTPGKQTVTVADTSLRSAKGTSNAVSVTGTLPLVINHFIVTGLPSSDVTGTVHPVTITAVNATGKTVTNYTGTVQLTSSDAAFTPFSVTFAAANKGVMKTSVKLTTLGLQSLTATDGNGKMGTESNILVVSPATQLGVKTSATTITAGLPVTVTVTGLTASKAPDGLFADTLQLTTSDPHARVVAQPISSGSQQFTITFTTAGMQTITVTDLTRPAIKGPLQHVSVSAGAATQLSVTGFPLFALTGLPQHFTVTAEDAFGNHVLSGFKDTVQVGSLSWTFQPNAPASHMFMLTPSAAGALSLTANDITNTSLQSGSENVTIVSSSPGMVADPLSSGQMALVIIAPAGGATVMIMPVTADGRSVSVTITANGKTTHSGPFTPTGHIFVYGQSGNDVIEEVANANGVQVAVPAMLFAGSGNCTLSAAGSSANNVLIGGPGADILTGGSGGATS